MAENFLVRCISRAPDHGSWRAGFHWNSDGERDVVVTREQVLELRGDKLISLMIIGKTSREPTLRDDVVNDKRLVADAKTVDDSFLDGVPVIDAPVLAAAPAPEAAAPEALKLEAPKDDAPKRK